jgi:hypothetical protein
MNILPKQHKVLLSACTLGISVWLGNPSAHAQVKVGDNPENINAGSVLEVESSNKGLLLPRVALAKTTTWSLSGTPVAGMQVYNSNAQIITGATSYPTAEGGVGVYYWDGTGWVSAKKGQAASGGDYDWLKTSNNATPSDPADIGSAIYHGGTGNQEVTLRSNSFVPGAFARSTAIVGHGSAQPAVTGLFAEYNSSADPVNGPEYNAVTGIQTTTQHPLIFRTTGSNNVTTERMRITPEGGVGIGTPQMFASESTSLRVNGPIFQLNSDLLFNSTQSVHLRNGGIELFSSEEEETNGFIDFRDDVDENYDSRIMYSNDIGSAGALLFRVKGQNTKDAIAILNSNGYVGINRTNPNYQLDVTGDINATGEVRNSGVILTSDKRLKRNILPLKSGLNIVSKLNPVSYEKKATLADSVFDKSEIGFIAQEVQKILPQLVREGKDADKTLALDYNSLIPVLTQAIQEQQKQIEKLSAERDGQAALLNKQSAELNAQSDKLNVQSTRLDAQSAELAEIKRLLNVNSKGNTSSVSR